MSMTLEQVIADCEEEISDCQIDLDGIAKLLEEYPERKEAFTYYIDDYKKRMDFNRQLAEWLKELAERRKLPEIIYCGECELKIECCRNIRSGGRKDDDFCSCGRRAERRTDG